MTVEPAYRFVCGRCKCDAFLTHDEHDKALATATIAVPTGWTVVDGGVVHFCPQCFDAWVAFIESGKPDAELYEAVKKESKRMDASGHDWKRGEDRLLTCTKCGTDWVAPGDDLPGPCLVEAGELPADKSFTIKCRSCGIEHMLVRGLVPEFPKCLGCGLMFDGIDITEKQLHSFVRDADHKCSVCQHYEPYWQHQSYERIKTPDGDMLVAIGVDLGKGDSYEVNRVVVVGQCDRHGPDAVCGKCIDPNLLDPSL